MLITVFVIPIQPALILMDIAGFTAALLLLVCGLYCSWRRVPQCSPIRCGMGRSFFYSGAACFALRNMSILPANFVTLHGIQIGSAIEMLLLSFALAARFNKIEEAKRASASRYRGDAEKQEAILEAKVATRTEALEKLANYDMLTGLLNRHGLVRHADA
ncbi:diguanylate cyclase, partial [Halomonas sp. SUBG004]